MIEFDSAVRLLAAGTAEFPGAADEADRLAHDVVASVVDLGLSHEGWSRLAGSLAVPTPFWQPPESLVGIRILAELPFAETHALLLRETDGSSDDRLDDVATVLLAAVGDTGTRPGLTWLETLAPDDVARGFALAMGRTSGFTRLRLAALLRGVTISRRHVAPPPPSPPAWSPPPSPPSAPGWSSSKPPPAYWGSPAPPAGPPPPSPASRRSGWFSGGRKLRGRRRSYETDEGPATVGADPHRTDEIAIVAPPTSRDAYALIRCAPVWVTETPVEVVIGLTDKQMSTLTTTPGPVVDVGRPIDDLEVILLVDPASLLLAPGQAHRIPLPVTEAVAFPTVTVTMTARADVTLAPTRRIGLHFVRGGRSVGFAWRTVTVVDAADLVVGAQPPPPRGVLVDLSPLLADDPPELVVTITQGDSATTPTYVWSAYTTLPDVVVADLPASSALASGEAARFATEQRRAIASTTTGLPLFDYLVGRGVQIGQAVPPGIADTLRAVASRPGARAPGVLLLTEEPFVPWELAVLDGGPAPAFGAQSRFLGAHVAVSRWPLSVGPPRTSPSAAHAATRLGVLTATYDDVRNWPKLPHAEAEAVALAAAYGPATSIAPVWDDVRRCLRGEPPVDVLHVALHGQFDADGAMDGIVLLQPDGKGNLQQQFLTTNQIAGWDLVTRPFVFLNACQVAAGNTVLGSYSGMAATLVRQGATGAVAPLWNVDDEVAAGVTGTFYADVYGADAVPVAEALRRIRAGYTEAAVEADPTAVTPTLIAYQFFGHPKLTLHREPVS